MRFYLKKTDEELRFSLKTERIEKPYYFDVSNYIIQTSACRSFDDIPSHLSKREPLAVFYANIEEQPVSCPGDANPSDITPLYDYVVVVYAEPLPHDSGK